MDEADIGNDKAELFLAASINNVLTAKPTGPEVTAGACNNCGEPFGEGDDRIYCDADCRDDHAKRHAATLRNVRAE